jgi:beta-lactam-binding protein with PASTA domain
LGDSKEEEEFPFKDLWKMKTASIKSLFVNAGVAFGVLILLSLIFFYIVLPQITNKGEVVTVPDLSGMTLDEAIRALSDRDLEYRIDSSYRFEAAPLTVIDQYPNALSKVKVNRKIEITLNARIAPSVHYPDLTGASYDFVLTQLKSLDLKIGNVKYQQDIAHNSILESRVDNEVIQPGQLIPKGTMIDLIVGRDSLRID